MIEIMIYIISGILTFISFISLYHFMILRSYKPKFYQKVNINDKNYQDIRKYKLEYNNMPIYFFTLIPIAAIIILIYAMLITRHSDPHTIEPKLLNYNNFMNPLIFITVALEVLNVFLSLLLMIKKAVKINYKKIEDNQKKLAQLTIFYFSFKKLIMFLIQFDFYDMH